jgi:pimeloyl-ACP methyl ester carboxylesterase
MCIKRQGYASVRYDKRGVGESAAAGPADEEAYRFDGFVDDAIRWVAYLRADARVGPIVVAGHSEGSLIGMLAAQEPVIDGLISLAGAGRPAADLLREQLARQLPLDLLAQANAILDELVNGRIVADVPVELMSIFRPSVQPYLMSWFAFDPAREIARLSMPVLIVQGETDIQIGVADAQLLANAQPDANLLLISEMNHVLKSATGAPSSQQLAYSNPTVPLAGGLVDGLEHFVAPID